jgi:DNA-directed RNA polymerase subunit RPC12/RpoP
MEKKIADYIKEQIKKEIEKGCLAASKATGKKVILVPNSLKIEDPLIYLSKDNILVKKAKRIARTINKLSGVNEELKGKPYTYTCNKCKKDFETTIEFTNDKRYIRSLRCPDCAFRNIFEAANKKPKIKRIK